jgi:2-C-methyl-D-erythritol 4-phosphate cytidylyltransferase
MSAALESGGAVHALLPAAGSGRRFATEVPKQYQPLLGRPLLAHSIDIFCGHPGVVSVTLVLAEDDNRFGSLLGGDYPGVMRVAGGATRAESVLNGLRHLLRSHPKDDWALVHDAARPCLSRVALDRLMARGMSSPDGGILAVPVVDTIKRGHDGRIQGTIDRSALWAAQTPQLFPLGILADALSVMLGNGLSPTDEAGAMEHAGYFPALVEGDRNNIKVTQGDDLALAAHILSRNAGGTAR